MKVVVFDIDDTLYKEIDFLKSAYLYIANILESEYPIVEVYAYMMSCFYDKKNVFQSLIDHFQIEISIDFLIKLYREHIPNIKIASITLFPKLVEKGIKIGLLSDGKSITQRNKIGALHLSEFVQEDMIIISEEFGSEKPSVNNYLYFQKKYPNADFLYVGDNPIKDFIAPNSLGWTTVMLNDNGENIHSQKIVNLNYNYYPLFKIDTIDDVLKHI